MRKERGVEDCCGGLVVVGGFLARGVLCVGRWMACGGYHGGRALVRVVLAEMTQCVSTKETLDRSIASDDPWRG